MSYKVGDKVYVPYGAGDRGTIVEIKRFLGIPRYHVHSDTYSTIDVVYRYFGWRLTRADDPVSDLVVKSINANTDVTNPPSDPKRKANT